MKEKFKKSFIMTPYEDRDVTFTFKNTSGDFREVKVIIVVSSIKAIDNV